MARAEVSPGGLSVQRARLPFAEQIAFWRAKLGRLVPTARWDDLWQEQHDRAFMVAGAAKADLLADLAAAIDRAIADGQSIGKFRKAFRAAVERHDWHGWTGEGTRKGRAWRTRIIYRTNLLTSYAAGRGAQLREGGFRWWVYHHDDSVLHPRPLHQSWDGLMLSPDDPFWSTHYPPNGWGCHCYVTGAHTESAARAMGGDPDKRIASDWRSTDAKTGAPPGIDKGWAYAPGASVTDTVRMLTPKLDRLPSTLSVAVIQDWLKLKAFERWLAEPDGSWPLVRLNDADAERLGAGQDVRVAHLSAETANKQKREHPEMTSEEYLQAQMVVDDPDYKQIERNTKTGTQSLVYVRVIAGGDAGGHVLVVKATKSGRRLFVTSYRRLSRIEAERDREIQRIMRRMEK
ncbi:MAG TPA: virion morphogenesis protein [Chromatiales bacterium]|nr:virion morphogenesis protein [Chromatiales bacterium]